MKLLSSNHDGPDGDDSRQSGVEHVLPPIWLALAIGAALSMILVGAIEGGSPFAEIAFSLVGFILGVGITRAIDSFIASERDIRRAGDLYRFIEDYVSRVEDLLIDNPEIAENEVVRHVLLPSAEELEKIPFHPSFKANLLEMRAGTSWLLQGAYRACLSIPSLRLTHLCLKRAGHDEGMAEIWTIDGAIRRPAPLPRTKRSSLGSGRRLLIGRPDSPLSLPERTDDRSEGEEGRSE